MNKINKYMLYFTFAITIITFFIIILPSNNLLYTTYRIIFWSIFILFLPWYYITMAFFKEKEIDFLERFALSFAFSISVVPLATFYLNLIGYRITDLNVFLVCLLIITLCIGYIYFMFKKIKWKEIS